MKTSKLIKINDGVIIKRERLTGYKKDKYDPKACHYYIALYNKKKQAYAMYPTSHYIDPSKATDVKRGKAILMKIKGAPGVSTVYKIPRTKDVHGQPFKSDTVKAEYVGRLTKWQQRKLKKFISKKKK